MNLAARASGPELMDGDDVSPDDFALILNDLARANDWTLGRRPTLAWLGGATAGLERFTLLDVGFGQGDMLRAIARRWPAARLIGIDLNPRSAPVAAALTDSAMGIQYVTGDLYEAKLPRPDFVISSLVAHHMTEAELVRFLRWQAATAIRGWFVNDLHRHWLARRGFGALAWALRWHPVVRHDGQLSVARAFRRDEWRRLLGLAGIREADVKIAWRMPFRLCVGQIR